MTGTSGLPVARSLRPDLAASLIFALLTAVAAAAGILYPEALYPAGDLRDGFLANDILTLLVGLPVLLIAVWLAWRGSLLGLLIWPGAILYSLYNYLAYLFGMPFSGLFPLYLAIVALGLYALIALVSSVDGTAVRAQLNGHVPERLAGALLLLAGLIFGLRALVLLVGHASGRAPVPVADLPVTVADFLVAPLWVLGGLLLWQKRPFGYTIGPGLLVNLTMLFVGIIGIVILTPLLGGAPYPPTDLIILLIMGILFSIPLALFVRGIHRS